MKKDIKSRIRNAGRVKLIIIKNSRGDEFVATKSRKKTCNRFNWGGKDGVYMMVEIYYYTMEELAELIENKSAIEAVELLKKIN